MKRKILTDQDCMSGSGWMPDDAECFECPVCYERLEFEENQRIVTCRCGEKLKIERGVQYLTRIVEK